MHFIPLSGRSSTPVRLMKLDQFGPGSDFIRVTDEQ
jgi:hypothetical protein